MKAVIQIVELSVLTLLSVCASACAAPSDQQSSATAASPTTIPTLDMDTEYGVEIAEQTKILEAPTLASETPTILPPTTTPPAATVSNDDMARNLSKLIQTNLGCFLPCFWSISPGVSNLDTTREILQSYGFLWGNDNVARMRVDNVILSLQFESESDTVQSIYVRSDDMSQFSDYQRFVFSELWKPYGPTSLLEEYGRPSRVFIYHPFQFDPGGGPGFHLVIVYDDQGILAEYWGSAEYLREDHYRACTSLENVGSLSLLLYRDGGNDPIESIIPFDNISHIAERATAYGKVSWQEATGISLDGFYEAHMAGKATPCFEFVSK